VVAVATVVTLHHIDVFVWFRQHFAGSGPRDVIGEVKIWKFGNWVIWGVGFSSICSAEVSINSVFPIATATDQASDARQLHSMVVSMP